MLKKICLIIVMFFAKSVFAECDSNSCDSVKINEMHVFYDGAVWVGTSGTESNLTNCTSSSSLIKVETATTGGKNIYSALLSAQARDKEVWIRTMDNVIPCQAHYVVVK